MLVTLNEVLKDAQKNHYAVGLFNTVSLEMARAVLNTAEELRAPVIVGTAEILLSGCSLRQLSEILLPMIQRANIPVVLHYDHGLTWEKVMEALRCGFSSVMYDCSGKSYEENVRSCGEMVKIARAFGATVEAELGHVGEAKDEGKGVLDVYTQPEQAREFGEKTQVDALAVAIGTAHGPYLTKPKLDLERLAQIRKATDIPLVLHGGSGLTKEDFQNCIARGIAKINIFTDIDRAGMEGIKKGIEAGADSITSCMPYAEQAMREAVREKLELFGCAGKA